MNFNEALTDMLYTRMETGAIREPLEATGTYTAAAGELTAVLEGIEYKAAERLKRAISRLCDLEAQYFYRVGMQDGLSITQADFPARGIE